MPQKKVGVLKSVSVVMTPGYAGRVSDRQPDPLPPAEPPLVAVVAPSCPVDRDLADRVNALAGDRVRLRWAEQCFTQGSHFAGQDRSREDALVDAWNDLGVSAIWCARGGAGAARVAEAAVARFDPAVTKPLLGYSDAGFLHAALLAAGRGGAVWGPMPGDLRRDGGEVAVERAIRWLAGRDRAEDHAAPPGEAVAFNLTVLCATLGTPVEPPLAGRVLMLEDVGEPLYRVDRMLWQLSRQPWFGTLAGVRLGRFSGLENDRAFGVELEEVARGWVERAGVPLLSGAEVGHDADNRLVVF